MIRAHSPSPSSRRLLASVFLLVFVLATRPAAAQPGIRSLAGLEQDVRFQPPSFRLEAMGGLGLAVRDEYNEVNLWDFAGLPLGLAADRDSTSLDLWVDTNGRAFDQRAGAIEYEVDRRRDTRLAGEAVVRSGDFAAGADFGAFSFRRGAPFGDRQHLTNDGNQPAFLPAITGRFGSSVRWGLRGLVAKESFTRQVWGDVVEDGKVKVGSTGDRLGPPHLFFPQEVDVPTLGIGGSLGYERRQGEGGLYLDYRHERVETTLETVRSIYESTEPRDILGYGVAAVVRPLSGTELGAQAGRELFSSTEDYRFSLSGGSVDPAFNGRGERLLRGDRRDFVRVRAQSDLSGTPVTVGAAFRVAYDRQQIQALEGRPSDFNEFVRDRVSADTIQAPPLVVSELRESRTLELGGGASLKVLDGRATVGAEYRRFRDALGGTNVLARVTGWEARAGGEVKLTSRWVARAGYRHHFEDEDDDTPRNELVADRATAGVLYDGLKGWTVEAFGYREWWRTDYPDPGELGGTGSGAGLFLRRLF